MDTIVLLHIFLILFNLFLYNLLIYRPFWVTLFVTVSVKDEQRESTWKWRREKGQAGSHDTLARATVSPPQPITTKLPLFSASVRAEGILARAEMTAREGQKERKKEKEGERQREREPNQAYISPFVSPLPIPHVNVSLPLRCWSSSKTDLSTGKHTHTHTCIKSVFMLRS